ncbi:hypothetical protein BpHYR1_029904 [Brachionus plicatilis]|uniref:Uncharacterized protein n=1 Tax=Brachionus plicatilis TaxID=10195 RepID=A0A3M7PLS9_BRAPC|nr:hypothetical protein BpHYR1_029904 [Brachionus plicatilis]
MYMTTCRLNSSAVMFSRFLRPSISLTHFAFSPSRFFASQFTSKTLQKTLQFYEFCTPLKNFFCSLRNIPTKAYTEGCLIRILLDALCQASTKYELYEGNIATTSLDITRSEF